MRRVLLTALSAGAFLVAAPARADSACLSDAERLCPGVPIGEGRVLTCLRSRWSEVSSACQQDVQAVENRAREVTNACTGDIWQYCRNVLPGADRIRTCLWARWNDLSSTCRDEAARVAEKAQQLLDACGPDAQQLCPGLRPGGGQIFLCLKVQESKVSSQCRRALR